MKKLFVLFAAAGSLALGGCKKFLDVNTNVNGATTTDSRYIFTNALARTGSNQVGGVHTMGGSWVGFYAHSTSFSGGGQEKTYVFTNADFNYWDGMFDNLNDYQYVIENGAKDGAPYLVGPAKVMKAYVYQKLVDLYGNVPYSEAFQIQTNQAPKYDDAKTIYEDLIVRLTEAITDIKAASWPGSVAGVISADIAFNNNKTNWVKFANTVKMRILMRQSNMAGRDAYITGKINEIVTEGSGLLTDNMYIQPGYQKSSGPSGSKLNPFYANYGFDQNDAQSSNYAYRKVNNVLVSFLKATSDSFRLYRLAEKTPASTNATIFASYVGIPLGAASGYLEANASSIGSAAIKQGDATRPLILVSASDAYFLAAEAAQRYGITAFGSAQTAYENGVRWAFRNAAALYSQTPSATTSEADAAANRYLTSGQQLVDFTASTDKLRAIWVQKWLALVHVDGLEAWSEYRRTNSTTSNGAVPTSPRSTAVSASQAEPVRLFYPQREQNVNSTNYQSVNVFTNRIFWDVN